jgi:hypothetical protein
MILAEDPFSHTYVGSSEFNVAAFSTSFDRKSFGRRIVAKINTNLNKPTISADQSWAYLNFGTLHKHCFLYDTGALVTLIMPQTFKHARQNGKVGKKWAQHGIRLRMSRVLLCAPVSGVNKAEGTKLRMSSAQQVNELAKNISCVEIAQRKQAERKSTSSQGVAARAYERATAWQRGEGGHVTRSTRKQLEQIPNLRSVLSLVESSTDFLEALQDTNKSLTTGMTLPRTPNPQMPQKGHTTGGKKSKKKSERRSTSDQDATQLEEEQEQQQPLSAMFSDNARFEDLAADMENQERQREVLQPRTESLVLTPQQAEDEENSSQSVTKAGNVKTTKKNVQPGPTGPPGPSGQTRLVSGATAAVGSGQGQKKKEGHRDRNKVREIARKVGRSDQIWMNLTRILTLIYPCILLTIRNSALK